jgi:hypothetical protein
MKTENDIFGLPPTIIIGLLETGFIAGTCLDCENATTGPASHIAHWAIEHDCPQQAPRPEKHERQTMKRYLQNVAVDNAIKARIKTVWNDTRMAGESGTPITAQMWDYLVPAEQERLEDFAHALVTNLIDEDALPEPDDDWQECGFNDFLPTDKRVKAVFAGGSIIEGTPDRRNHEHVFLVDGPVIHSYDDATFYRIPAPVQHPDPAQHPVILDPHTTDDEVFDYAVWDAEDFYLCYTHEGEYMRGAEPSEITKFTPAKVVAEDDR